MKLSRCGSRFVLTLQINEHIQLILEDTSSAPDCFLGIDGPIGLNVDDQLVQVCSLLHAGGLDRIAHTSDRAE